MKENILVNGQFVLVEFKNEEDFVYGIVINDKVIYESGSYDLIEDINDNTINEYVNIVGYFPKANCFNECFREYQKFNNNEPSMFVKYNPIEEECDWEFYNLQGYELESNMLDWKYNNAMYMYIPSVESYHKYYKYIRDIEKRENVLFPLEETDDLQGLYYYDEELFDCSNWKRINYLEIEKMKKIVSIYNILKAEGKEL